MPRNESHVQGTQKTNKYTLYDVSITDALILYIFNEKNFFVLRSRNLFFIQIYIIDRTKQFFR
jgi:hypothetical protein